MRQLKSRHWTSLTVSAGGPRQSSATPGKLDKNVLSGGPNWRPPKSARWLRDRGVVAVHRALVCP